MKKFLSTVIVIVIASLLHAQSVNIVFDVTADHEYICRIVSQKIQSEDDMVKVIGKHLISRTNEDVLILESVTSVIEVFPDLIINVFSKLQTARLTRTGMKRFSNSIQNCTTLNTILLGFNKLTSLPVGIFKNCRNLTEISLTTNLLTDLDNDAFNGLKNLRILDLSNNKFVYVKPNYFKPLIGLRELNLAQNEISEVAPDLFESMPRLNLLNLTSNKIVSWNQAILASNLKLFSLMLSDNLIDTISDDMFPDTLEHLSVGSLIESIPQLTRYKILQQLDLNNNKIKKFSIEIFDQLLSLKVLKIGGNEISTSRSTKIQEIKTLRLENNIISDLSDEIFFSLTFLPRLLVDISFWVFHNVKKQLTEELKRMESYIEVL